MSYTEGSDPTAMGRQWLELQKLRNKAKKKVDTKASKGRKIRSVVSSVLMRISGLGGSKLNINYFGFYMQIRCPPQVV